MKKLSAFFVLCAFAVCACGGGGGTPPTVTSTNAAGKRIYPTSAISVTFSAAMDQASVEAAFQISGSGPIEGAFAWADNTVTFTPAALLKTNHLYTMTIQTSARDAQGNALAAVYTQAFEPKINMHDVNGDGIDDFVVSAPNNDENGTNSGMLYLFLGKTGWSNVDLSAQTADAQYSVSGGTELQFGFFTNIVGDINGDGFADIVAGSPQTTGGGTAAGFIIIIYGSAAPAGRIFTLADTDADVLVGPAADTHLGEGVYPAGDVNGDGLGDFIVGGEFPPNDSQFWLVLGKTTPYGFMQPVTNFSAANYIVSDSLGLAAQPFNSCDVNGDELDDIVLSAPNAAGGGTDRGLAYFIAASATLSNLDLRSQAPTALFTGAQDGDHMGFIPGCADVNSDGYDDLILSAPGGGSAKGVNYLVLGSASPVSLNFATDSASAVFTGATTTTEMGFSSSMQGDVNNDGYNDMIFGAPLSTTGGVNMGEAFLFFGSATPASVDLSAGGAAGATFTGEAPPTGLHTVFGLSKPVGDINGDGIDDMLFNAPGAPDGSLRGVLYIVFGSTTPVSLNFGTDSANATVTGHANGDILTLSPLI